MKWGAKLKIKRINDMVAQELIEDDTFPISPFISVSSAAITQVPKQVDELDVFIHLSRARLELAKSARDQILSFATSKQNQSEWQFITKPIIAFTKGIPSPTSRLVNYVFLCM